MKNQHSLFSNPILDFYNISAEKLPRVDLRKEEGPYKTALPHDHGKKPKAFALSRS